MKQFFVIILFLLSGLIITYFYDGYKAYSSSWTANIYFTLKEEQLNKLVQNFNADTSLKSVGLGIDGRLLYYAFDNKTAPPYKTIYDKYGPLLDDLNLFGGPFCSIWMKVDNKIVCTGLYPAGHERIDEIKKPKYLFSLVYFIDSNAEINNCNNLQGNKLFGSCDFALSDGWALHYDWFAFDE